MSYEGITLKLGDDFTLLITPNMKEIKLEDWGVKGVYFDYEKKYCGCCEGDHEQIGVNAADFCHFITSGGYEKINNLNETIKKQDKIIEDQDEEIRNLKTTK